MANSQSDLKKQKSEVSNPIEAMHEELEYRLRVLKDWNKQLKEKPPSPELATELAMALRVGNKVYGAAVHKRSAMTWSEKLERHELAETTSWNHAAKANPRNGIRVTSKKEIKRTHKEILEQARQDIKAQPELSAVEHIFNETYAEDRALVKLKEKNDNQWHKTDFQKGYRYFKGIKNDEVKPDTVSEPSEIKANTDGEIGQSTSEFYERLKDDKQRTGAI